ncbi:unnamed protein product, partial [Mesorhabditis belari]|uniref:Uncharacterized protein n=1 Tax=Mesorhabditis belari TaxID=2138241 RepID=A0AAF3FGI1_9BILA
MGVGFFVGMKSVLYDFAVWSTVAAIPHIADAKTRWTRYFWLFVFILMMLIFLGELYAMIRKFLQFPTEVDTIIQYSQLPFPAVTICNLNPYKYTVVKDTSSYPKFASVLSLTNVAVQAIQDNYKSTCPASYTGDNWGIAKVCPYPYELETTTKDALIIEMAKLSKDDKEPALYTYDDLVTECSFNSRPCNITAFTSFVDPVYGACYSFNGAGSSTNATFQSSRAGMKFGLKILMTPTQTQPDGTPDVLPITQLAGARVSVHEQGAFPSLEGSGISVGVGYLTAISITMTSTERMKKPYGNCVERESSSTDYYQSYYYTLETCYLGCKQRYNVEKCSCAHPRFASSSSQTICDQTALSCIQTLKGDQLNKSQPNIDPMVDCNCYPPCNQKNYATTTSLASFPASNYFVAADSASATSKGSCSPSTTQFDPTDSGSTNASKAENCREWYGNNSLLLEVFYESLNYQQYIENPNYGISAVLNDLGGHAGLWLGLSIISVVEICGLLGILCIYICGGRRKMIDPSMINEDSRIRDLDDIKNDLDNMEAEDKVKEAQAKEALEKKEAEEAEARKIQEEKDAAEKAQKEKEEKEKEKDSDKSDKSDSDSDSDDEKKEDKKKD